MGQRESLSLIKINVHRSLNFLDGKGFRTWKRVYSRKTLGRWLFTMS